MRIAFVDPIDFDYVVDTPDRKPLGGSQSALCYLSRALADRGHEVCTWTDTTTPGVYRGVRCQSLQSLPLAARSVEADAWVILNSPSLARWLRAQVAGRSKIVLWTQHTADQPAMRELADHAVRDAHDAYAFVSDWQRAQYLAAFGLPGQRAVVRRNAIAPVFEHLFSADERILAAKRRPPIIAYTSTPFRGLNLLLELFPRIRSQVPDVRLRVYSSMRVYQVRDAEDERQFGWLYAACRTMPNVEYAGSLSQPELAADLRWVGALAYPNIFPETSCIAVMEAMAAGCVVVTSDLGALAETTAGFGRLIPMRSGAAGYGPKFVDALVDALQGLADPARADLEELLRKQRRHVLETYTWRRRAGEWETWLQGL